MTARKQRAGAAAASTPTQPAACLFHAVVRQAGTWAAAHSNVPGELVDGPACVMVDTHARAAALARTLNSASVQLGASVAPIALPSLADVIG
jgi:hypothetical protein